MLSRYAPFDDRESEVAWFKTRIPWLAPEAYLNIVYKPADPTLLRGVSERWDFPEELTEFLLRQNGAHLFGGVTRRAETGFQRQIVSGINHTGLSVPFPFFSKERERKGGGVA